MIGIVSIGDLVKSIIGDQRFAISQLEHYIHGEQDRAAVANIQWQVNRTAITSGAA